MLTIVTIEDFKYYPSVQLELPAPLRIGDSVSLPRFSSQRDTAEGRLEVLRVEAGRYRVLSVELDATNSYALPKQLLRVESVGVVPPTWKAVKRPLSKFPVVVLPKN